MLILQNCGGRAKVHVSCELPPTVMRLVNYSLAKPFTHFSCRLSVRNVSAATMVQLFKQITLLITLVVIIDNRKVFHKGILVKQAHI